MNIKGDGPHILKFTDAQAAKAVNAVLLKEVEGKQGDPSNKLTLAARDFILDVVFQLQQPAKIDKALDELAQALGPDETTALVGLLSRVVLNTAGLWPA